MRIGSFDELLIAEATIDRTPLAGMTLRESELRKRGSISTRPVEARRLRRSAPGHA